ncbi:MAG TPA: flagellar basal body-associated FliL family protein [Pyrinomonadaceae bacterium]|nr:flagellar basal body-associated FliL family protein [Pyrinomonadaceae bacterium]
MAIDEDKLIEEPKKRGKKMIIVIAAVVLLAAAGGGGFYYWRVSSVAAAEVANKKASDKKARSNKDSEEPAAQVTDAKSIKKGSDPMENVLPNDEDVKKIVELPPFIVNLVDTEQARYLRMTVSLGVDGEGAAGEKPDQLFITRVRNAMLAVLSNKKSDEILSIEGKAKLRKELLSAAQAASANPEVKAIYITDFIVQL